MNYNWIWNIYLTRSDIIDSEGIAYVGTNSATGKHKFAVVEESKNIGKHAFLYIFEIDRSTTQINLATQATEYDLGDMASDDGIEGVSYGGKDISGNLIFYVVRQTPKDVRKVVVVSGTTTVVSNTRLFDSTALSDVGWLRDLYYDNNTNSLFILGVGASDTAPRKVINVRLDGTRIYAISGIDVGSPIKPEGIVFDKFGDYMYVVGEPHHLSAFKTANYHSNNNFTNLLAGIYYYNVSVEDFGGNKAATSTRKITLDTAPLIWFVPPTLLDGAVTADASVEINASIIEYYLQEVKFNWNEVNYTLYDDSLVLMMNMDNLGILGESSALIKDLSKYGNDGIVQGGAVFSSTGKYGGAFDFDGIDDFITTRDILSSDIGDSLTVSLWVYPVNLL